MQGWQKAALMDQMSRQMESSARTRAAVKSMTYSYFNFVCTVMYWSLGLGIICLPAITAEYGPSEGAKAVMIVSGICWTILAIWFYLWQTGRDIARFRENEGLR